MSLMVADLDKPFHGFMVVRLDSVVDVIRLLDHTCLRHSKSMMGIGKSSILASVELPPEDAPPDEESPRDVVKGGRAVSFRSRSYMDNFKKQPPSMVYRTASGRFSPKEQQGILAMARLRTAGTPRRLTVGQARAQAQLAQARARARAQVQARARAQLALGQDPCGPCLKRGHGSRWSRRRQRWTAPR